MNTLKTKPEKKPAPGKRPNATQNEIPLIAPLALPHLLAFFSKSWKKVRFPDRESAKRGFRILYRSGYSVDISGDFIFGVSAPEQLELLTKNNVRYELVD